MAETLLQVKDLARHFKVGKGKVLEAVDGVSFDISRGETFGLVGESGCGKSTLGRTVIGLYPPTKGEVRFDGIDVAGHKTMKQRLELARRMQMIFQDPYTSLNPRMKVMDIIAEGIDNLGMASTRAERSEMVLELLRSVGLDAEHAGRYPHEFSGGQRQRVGIARAMIMDPKFIVADEPISALDVSIRAQVLNLMNRLKAEKNLTYLFIAHDLSVVRFIADRIAVIHRGEIVEIAESETLFRYPIHPYTISLLSTVPMPDPIVEKTRRHIVYDPSQLDQSGAPREMREIRPGHFVHATEKEFAEYEEKLAKMEAERRALG